MKRVLLAAAAVWLGGVLRLAAQTPDPDPDAAARPRRRPPVPDDTCRPESGTADRGLRQRQRRPGQGGRRRRGLVPRGVRRPGRRAARHTTITYWQLRPDDDLRRQPRRLQSRRQRRLDSRERPEPDPGGPVHRSRGSTPSTERSSPSGSIPGSIPAAFHRAPGRQRAGSRSRGPLSCNVNLETGVTTVHRSALTTWYSDMAVGAGRRSLARGLRQQPHRALRPRRRRPRRPGRSSRCAPAASIRRRSTSTTRASSGFRSSRPAGWIASTRPPPTSDRISGISNPIHFDIFQGQPLHRTSTGRRGGQRSSIPSWAARPSGDAASR